MTDELNEPLGRGIAQRQTSPVPRRLKLAAGAMLFAAGAAALLFAPRDPFSGQPHVIARIEPAKPPEPTPPPPVVASETSAASPSGQDFTGAGDLEQFTGVKVTRRGAAADGSGARIIRIDPPSGVKLTPAPDRRVVERGPHGPLPKIGADGARPMDVYGRPFVTSAAIKLGAPKIALVIGGVGLNAQATAAAIDELPEAVTLAFAPYGADLDRVVAQARARGHEALLQAPMEPFDYPQNNPGPHTLLTSAPEGGLDDLHWIMSRFSGYAGVMNHLGGRFMADEAALTPALAEIGRRGLYFLDDGASAQSLTAALAPKLSAPYAKVDVILDARGSPQSLDAALAQLEARAREHGAAIGFANAMPATISRLARFSRDLERRGLALAPVSSVLAPKAASADARGGR